MMDYIDYMLEIDEQRRSGDDELDAAGMSEIMARITAATELAAKKICQDKPFREF